MQCLIEMINTPQEEHELREGIKPYVVDMAFSLNGTHVLLKVLLCLNNDSLNFIYRPIIDNFFDLAMDQNGLCVIKKVVAKIKDREDLMGEVGAILSDNAVILV